jgi:hypothetical protein
LLLINAGYVSQDDILLNLQGILPMWSAACLPGWRVSSAFENEMLPPDDRINVRLDLENIIIEGSRQLRELEQLQDEIPSLDMALKFTERPLTNVNLSVDEWKVVKFVDPKNTMRQIAKHEQADRIEVRRIVYGLITGRSWWNWCAPSNTPWSAEPKDVPNADKEEQKSLINKLIGRIRTM